MAYQSSYSFAKLPAVHTVGMQSKRQISYTTVPSDFECASDQTK